MTAIFYIFSTVVVIGGLILLYADVVLVFAAFYAGVEPKLSRLDPAEIALRDMGILLVGMSLLLRIWK